MGWVCLFCTVVFLQFYTIVIYMSEVVVLCDRKLDLCMYVLVSKQVQK